MKLCPCRPLGGLGIINGPPKRATVSFKAQVPTHPEPSNMLGTTARTSGLEPGVLESFRNRRGAEVNDRRTLLLGCFLRLLLRRLLLLLALRLLRLRFRRSRRIRYLLRGSLLSEHWHGQRERQGSSKQQCEQLLHCSNPPRTNVCFERDNAQRCKPVSKREECK